MLRYKDVISVETFRRWRRHLQRDLEFAAFGLQRRWRAGSLTDKEKILLRVVTVQGEALLPNAVEVLPEIPAKP